MKILNKDELVSLRENDLKKIFLSLRSKIKEIEGRGTTKSVSKNEKLRELQTYYCYVYRELEHRRIV